MKTIALIAAALLCPIAMHGITLAECRQMARDNYPLLRSYGLMEQTAQFTVEMAQKAWLPQVTLGAQASWQNDVASYPDALRQMLASSGMSVKGLSKWQYKASADVRQTIYDGGRTQASQQLTRLETQEQLRQNDVDLYALDARVDELFFSLLLLDQQHAAVDASCQLLAANITVAEAMLAGGTIAQCDVDAMRAELATAQQQLDAVDAAKAGYRAVLAAYIGTEQFTDPELPAMPADASATAGDRPEQRLFDAKLLTLKAQEDAVQASLRPQVGAFASAYYGYPGFNYLDAMMKRDPTFNMQIGVSLTWNLSAFYTKRQSLGRIKAMAGLVDVSRATFEHNQRLEAASRNTEIDRWRKVMSHDAQIVELRQRVRRAEEAKLREGTINAVALLRALTDERTATINANTNKIEMIKAYYNLQHTLGQ